MALEQHCTNAINVNTTLFQCHFTIVCFVGINYSQCLLSIDDFILICFFSILKRETYIQLIISANMMSEEIYYTVSDELKEKGNDIFYYFCHHHYI